MRGFSLLEVVIVMFMVVLVLPSLSNLYISSTRSLADSQKQIEAAYLAAEGVEIVRNMRDADYSDKIESKDGDYCASLSGTTWTLTSTTICPTEQLYNRVITFSAVERDGNGNIVSSGGTVDPKTKKVDVEVSWNSPGGAKKYILNTYVTNFLQDE